MLYMSSSDNDGNCNNINYNSDNGNMFIMILIIYLSGLETLPQLDLPNLGTVKPVNPVQLDLQITLPVRPAKAYQ